MRPTSVTPRHRLLGDLTWHLDAVCRPTEYNPADPEVFFPAPDDHAAIATAKALCAQCPVRRACLDAALETKDTWGVRGGLTEQEREHLHDTLPRRRDWTRVNEAIAGRDIHLTKAEREAIVLVAHQDTIPAERLAHILKVSRGHAMKLLRAVRRAAEHAASTAPDRTGFEQAA